jgi:futalosine hydrolase
MVDIVVCAATELECALLRQQLDGNTPAVAILRTGVGAVNAAHALTMFLSKADPKQIVVCGVGGAYPSSGLHIGDVVCAETECYGDLGATSPAGFLDMEALGLPVVESPVTLFNELPMHVFPVARQARFVTVSSCTGVDKDARALERRTRGHVENMEGAAIAHVAHLHGLPVGEVRGISNLVTDRDASTWRLQDAAQRAQEAVLTWIARR